MHIEAIAIGVFVFVAVMVAGNRALNSIERRRREREQLRRLSVTDRAKRTDYTGPRFTVRGREIGQ